MKTQYSFYCLAKGHNHHDRAEESECSATFQIAALKASLTQTSTALAEERERHEKTKADLAEKEEEIANLRADYRMELAAASSLNAEVIELKAEIERLKTALHGDTVKGSHAWWWKNVEKDNEALKGKLAALERSYSSLHLKAEGLVRELERKRECFEFMAVETDPEILAENADPMTIEQLHKHFEEELDDIEKALAAFRKREIPLDSREEK